MKVAVLATGIGNVRSVVRALDHAAVGAAVETTHDPDAVRRADVLVVPGQGSFGSFVEAISGGLREALVERIGAGVPYLGICLGLQALFDESDEAPGARGLGVLRGRVRRLAGEGLALPHMGWNAVVPRGAGLLPAAHFYFAHSYAAVPADEDVILTTTEYGASFVSAVRKDNVVGVQFHPEKSQRAGLAFVGRFFAEVAGSRAPGG